jgi:hypothetical protein
LAVGERNRRQRRRLKMGGKALLGETFSDEDVVDDVKERLERKKKGDFAEIQSRGWAERETSLPRAPRASFFLGECEESAQAKPAPLQLSPSPSGSGCHGGGGGGGEGITNEEGRGRKRRRTRGKRPSGKSLRMKGKKRKERKRKASIPQPQPSFSF